MTTTRYGATLACVPVLARFRFERPALAIQLALPVSEASRAALMGIHGELARAEGRDTRSRSFSGKDASGAPLRGHQHVWFVATDDDGDSHLDHLTILGDVGLSGLERKALAVLRVIRFQRQSLPLIPAPLADCRLLTASRVWASATPYVATRRAKFRGRDRLNRDHPDNFIRFVTDNLRDQLGQVRRDIGGSLLDATPLPEAGGVPVKDFAFKRRRSADSGETRLKGAFRLTFAEPVAGPIMLGWACHIGMGLFVPEKESA